MKWLLGVLAGLGAAIGAWLLGRRRGAAVARETDRREAATVAAQLGAEDARIDAEHATRVDTIVDAGAELARTKPGLSDLARAAAEDDRRRGRR